MGSSHLEIGIIGTGGVCDYGHFPAMERAKGAKLLALCDVNEETCEAQSKLHRVPRTYCDYHELLADPDIDAVIIATPNHLHKAIAIDALTAGKHVLCEKPMAMTAADAAEVVEAARKNKRKLMVDFTHRFWNRSIRLKEAIDAGWLGEVYYIRLGWLRRRGTPSWGKNQWFTRKSLAGGGCLIDIGCHMIDLALWLAGCRDVTSLSGYVTQRFNCSAEESGRGGTASCQDVEDFAAASLTLKNNVHINMEVAWALNLDRAKTNFIDVYGSEAGASWRSGGSNGEPTPQLCFYRGDDRECSAEIADLMPETPSEAWVKAVQHFIDCIIEDREPGPSGECGLVTAKIIDAIYQSSRASQMISQIQ
jgi:predicted dehydrogenase